MSDDIELAALLGEAPTTPDPSFRFDVLARAAERMRRRASRQRALRLVIVSTLIGAVFPVARGLGVSFADVQPLLLVMGVLTLAYVLAALTIDGPRAVLARSRAILRAPVLRA